MAAFDDEVVDRHPSYAMAGFYRVSGDPGPLFGSTLARHHGFVVLRIKRAARHHSLGHDSFMGMPGGSLVEVKLSNMQFAELLTQMNVGDGVPVTLSVFNGERVPGPDAITLEATKVREGFREKMRALARDVKQDRQEIQTLIEKKSLTKDDRETIKRKLEKIVREIGSNAPFMLEQFEEATGRVVTAAKAEVDAFVTHAVTTAGMKALNMMPPDEPRDVKELVRGEQSDEPDELAP